MRVEGTLLKPSFPQPGLRHPSRAETGPEDIAMATATLVSRSVPTSVAGVLFLSGEISMMLSDVNSRVVGRGVIVGYRNQIFSSTQRFGPDNTAPRVILQIAHINVFFWKSDTERGVRNVEGRKGIRVKGFV